MTKLIVHGPAGRIEARHSASSNPEAPAALILHPHPLHGGSMNNKVTYALYHTFHKMGFHVCRFNFRGTGLSTGTFDNGEGELSDAACMIDWLQSKHPETKNFWVAGFSFGAWIAFQLLMRRPEIEGFVSVSPPTSLYDFSFLAPCPVSGQIIQGTKDEIVDVNGVKNLTEKLNKQKGIKVKTNYLTGADHFFGDHMKPLTEAVTKYLESRGFVNTTSTS